MTALERPARLASAYFQRRPYFRLALIVLILCCWAYIEIGELFPIKAHDLNYHALQTITTHSDKAPVTFAFLGDPKNSPVFQDIVARLNRDKGLQFAIIAGDLVLFPERETFRSFLKQQRALKIPSLVLPGNHDVAFDNMDLYYRIFGRMYFSFVVGNNQFILLDDSNEVGLGDEQEAWLHHELADGAQYRHRFVFMHVPLRDPRNKPDAKFHYSHNLKDSNTARRLEKLFLKYRVTVLFASHLHAYYDVTTKGLRTIISGGSGAELAGKDPEHTFYHYVRVTVTDRDVQTEVVRLDRDTVYFGLKKYISIAGFYIMSMGRIYVRYVLMGLFILVLAVDGLLEYMAHRKKRLQEQP